MGKLQATQKIKGTDTVKISVQILDAPENYTEMVKLAKDSALLQSAIMLAVNNEARNRTIARAGSLERAGQPVPASVDFVNVMTTYTKKITAASMCDRLEAKILALGQDMQAVVMSGDFDKAKAIGSEMAEITTELEAWQVKREAERVQKAASRKANEASK